MGSIYEEEKLYEFVIPENYKKGFSYRNIVEAVLVVGILDKLISITPFIFTVKLIAITVVTVIFGFIFVIGIKGESVFEFLSSYIRYRRSRKKLVLKIPSATDKKKYYDTKKYTQSLLPMKGSIEDGIVETADGRFIHICEIEPTNYELKTNKEKNAIIECFYSWLKQAPVHIHFKSITEPSNVSTLALNIARRSQDVMDENYKKLQSKYVNTVVKGIQSDALRRRFFLIIEYEGNADGVYSNNKADIKEAIWQTRSIAENFFVRMGTFIIRHENESVFQAQVLYLLNNRKTSLEESFEDRVKRITQDHMGIRGLDLLSDEMPVIDARDFIASKSFDDTHADYVINDGLYYTYIFFKNYPLKVTATWIDIITQMGDGIDVDVWSFKEDKNKILDSVNRSIRLSTSDANINSEKENVDDYIGNIMTGRYIRDCIKNNEDFFYGGTMVTIIANTKKELYMKKAQVERMLKSNDISIIDAYAHETDAFMMSLCLNYYDRKLVRKSRRNLLTSSLASFFMFTAYEMYDSNGIPIGLNVDNSSLAVIDIFNTQKFKNANAVILGTSGAGKTFTEQLLGRRMRLSNPETKIMYILPVKGYEYYRGCNDIGGSYIMVSPGSENCINIMEIRVVDDVDTSLIDGDMGYKEILLAAKIRQVINFIRLLLGNEALSKIEESMLDDALTAIYNSYGITMDNDSIWEDKENHKLKKMPIIQDLYDATLEIPELSRITYVLKQFVTGSCSNMNGQTNVDFSNNYIVFDLSYTGESLRPAFMYAVTEWAVAIIKENRLTNGVLFVDEAWKCLIEEHSAKNLLECAKVLRGYSGSIIFATQNVQDFFNYGDYGKAILGNVKIKLLLQLEDGEADLIQSMLKLSNSERNAITRFDRGQGMLIANNDKISLQIMATQEEIDAFTTDHIELNELEERRRKEQKMSK